MTFFAGLSPSTSPLVLAGVWLAGRLYDVTGSYRLVWWIAIGLSLMAAALNLPIKESLPPKSRLAAQP